MTEQATGDRLTRRKARTRAALLQAARTFIATGNTNVPILEITQADVGMGSFTTTSRARNSSTKPRRRTLSTDTAPCSTN